VSRESVAVFNLRTRDTLLFYLPPREALIAADRQDRGDFNTRDVPKPGKVTFQETEDTLSLGNVSYLKPNPVRDAVNSMFQGGRVVLSNAQRTKIAAMDGEWVRRFAAIPNFERVGALDAWIGFIEPAKVPVLAASAEGRLAQPGADTGEVGEPSMPAPPPRPVPDFSRIDNLARAGYNYAAGDRRVPILQNQLEIDAFNAGISNHNVRHGTSILPPREEMKTTYSR
jgi:hypothetical protein